jgi:hypothetical protein
MLAEKELEKLFAKTPSANDGDTGSEEFIYHVKIPFLRLSHQRRIKI